MSRDVAEVHAGVRLPASLRDLELEISRPRKREHLFRIEVDASGLFVVGSGVGVACRSVEGHGYAADRGHEFFEPPEVDLAVVVDLDPEVLADGVDVYLSFAPLRGVASIVLNAVGDRDPQVAR